MVSKNIQQAVDENNDAALDYYVNQDGHAVINRRKADKVLARLTSVEDATGGLSKQMEINTALTQHTIQQNESLDLRLKVIESDTKELLDILHGTKGIIKLLSFLIPISKFILSVGAAVLFVWFILKGKPELAQQLIK